MIQMMTSSQNHKQKCRRKRKKGRSPRKRLLSPSQPKPMMLRWPKVVLNFPKTQIEAEDLKLEEEAAEAVTAKDVAEVKAVEEAEEEVVVTSETVKEMPDQELVSLEPMNKENRCSTLTKSKEVVSKAKLETLTNLTENLEPVEALESLKIRKKALAEEAGAPSQIVLTSKVKTKRAFPREQFQPRSPRPKLNINPRELRKKSRLSLKLRLKK